MLHCVWPPLGRQTSLFKDGPRALQHFPHGPFSYRVGSGPIRIAGIVLNFKHSNGFYQFRRIIYEHYLDILPGALEGFQSDCGFSRGLIA
eukprot:12690247-Heterocapsa_arctica.AAC.2